MIRKILNIILIFVIFLTIFSYSNVFAASKSSPDNIISGANDFVTEGESHVKTGEALNTTGLVDTSNFIYNLLLAIAMIAAMAIGIALGIKFMMASASEKAEIKELLWPYVLGCIVVFGAMGIWKLAVSVFSGF